MPRNFYLSSERISGRSASSGAQRLQTGPHVASGAQRDSNSMRAGTRESVSAYDHSPALADPVDRVVVSFQSARALPPDELVNLRGGEKTVSSFIHDEREFAATCFVAGMAAAIGFTMFVLTFFAFTIFDFG